MPSGPRPRRHPRASGWVVRFDGKGVPMIKAEAVKRKAQSGHGRAAAEEQGRTGGGQRHRRSPAAVAGSPGGTPGRAGSGARAPGAGRRHGRWAKSAAGPACGQPGADEAGGDGTLKADAERREPQHRNPLVVRLDGALGRWHLATTRCREWKQVTFVLESMPVVGSLWSAANALFGEGSKAGKRWSLEGAEAILTRRSLKKSHDHALRDYWKFHARQVHRRLRSQAKLHRPMLRLRRVA